MAKKITADNAEAQGVCGADLTWYYKDNILVIRGTGDMNDYEDINDSKMAANPWEEENRNIQWIIVEDGCTKIGRYAFAYQINLNNVILPDSITSVSGSAFDSCNNIKLIKWNGKAYTSSDDFISDAVMIGICQDVAAPAAATEVESEAFTDDYYEDTEEYSTEEALPAPATAAASTMVP